MRCLIMLAVLFAFGCASAPMPEQKTVRSGEIRIDPSSIYPVTRQVDEWDGRCPECKAAGLRSIVREDGPTMSTLLAGSPAWYDEDGTYHPYVDPNVTTQGYACSRGHRFTRKY